MVTPNDTSKENSRRDLSKTFLFGIGTLLVVEQSSLESQSMCVKTPILNGAPRTRAEKKYFKRKSIIGTVFCNGVNTGVFASKYNFGINNLRCETHAVSIATSSKCNFLQKVVLGFEGRVPMFGGRLFGGFVSSYTA